MKMVKIGDILTDDQIKVARTLKGAKEICKQLIEPNIVAINARLGQENSPMYLAYAIEYALSPSKCGRGVQCE